MDVRYVLAVAMMLVSAGCSRTAENATASPSSDAAPAKAVAAGPAATAATVAATAAQTRGAPSAGQAPVTASLTETAFLPGERTLLVDAGLSAERSEAILGSDTAFAQTLAQFEQDAGRHPEAQDLTRLYKTAAVKAMGTRGELVSLACGFSLCVGELRSRTADDFTAWSDAFGTEKQAPVYSLIAAPAADTRMSGGRFVFSTDPGANSITVR